LLLGFLQHTHKLFVLALGIPMLDSSLVVTPAKRLKIPQHPIESTPKFGGIASEKSNRVLQTLGVVAVDLTRAMRSVPFGLVAGLGRRESAHGVAHEPSAPRPTVV
jgi:hypothetical protein